jgi:hypothetical protein
MIRNSTIKVYNMHKYIFLFSFLLVLASCKSSKIATIVIDGQNFINAKTLGIKGDGKSDDTKLIQSAFDKHENIYFPEGRYIISSSSLGVHNPQSILITDMSKVKNIQFDTNAVWIVSKKFIGPSTKNAILKIFADTDNIKKLVIYGFNLYCEPSDNGISHAGIFAVEHNGHNIKNLEISNARFVNCTGSAILTYALSTKLRNIYTENTSSHGIAAINPYNHGQEHFFYLDGYRSYNDRAYSIDFSGTEHAANRIAADPNDTWTGNVKNVVSINSKRGIKTAGYWNLEMENIRIENPEIMGLWLSKDTPGRTVKCKNLSVLNAGYTGLSLSGDCNFVGDSLTFIGCKEGIHLQKGNVQINKMTIDGKDKSIMALRFLTSGSIENFSILGNKDEYLVWLKGEKCTLKNGSIYNNDCQYGIIVHEDPKLTSIENVQFFDDRKIIKQLNDIIIIQKTGSVKISKSSLNQRSTKSKNLRVDNRSNVRVEYLD